MDQSVPLIILSTFFAVTLLFKLFFSMIMTKLQYRKRIKRYVGQVDMPKGKKAEIPASKGKQSSLKAAAKVIEGLLGMKKHENLLMQSGVKLSQGELLIGRFMTAIICFSISYLYGLHIVYTVVFGIAGFHLPVMYVKRKRKIRLQRCAEQLGNALGTMANALRAGFSFMQAMKMVAEEIEDPLGPEFLKALEEIKYGIPMETAFESLAKRLPDKELAIVLNTILIQRTSGGNLAYLMETMQETIIDRARVRDEVKSLTAQGRMSSVVITLLPIALALYIKFVNPEYFQMLFSHPLGWVMVVAGCMSIILGWFFIKKIVHIEV
ncbi:type II secretion system F family protein [Siminovitchia acidinfaciens]|nr:type II secretion system F family protein [Siminovitchia acidinfaciens]